MAYTPVFFFFFQGLAYSDMAVLVRTQVNLYTMLLLPILYVEFQNRGAGGDPCTAQY